MEVLKTEVHQYGVIKGTVLKDRLYQVEATVEKPAAKDAPSRMAIIGATCCGRKFFRSYKTFRQAGEEKSNSPMGLPNWSTNAKSSAASFSATATTSATNSALFAQRWLTH